MLQLILIHIRFLIMWFWQHRFPFKQIFIYEIFTSRNYVEETRKQLGWNIIHIIVPFGTNILLRENICRLAANGTVIILFDEPHTKQYLWVDTTLGNAILTISVDDDSTCSLKMWNVGSGELRPWDELTPKCSSASSAFFYKTYCGIYCTNNLPSKRSHLINGWHFLILLAYSLASSDLQIYDVPFKN